MDHGSPPRRPKTTWVEKRAGQARDVGAATAIPSMIAVGLFGGYFAGAWLEGRFGHEPWLSFAGLVLGGVASVRKIVQMLKQEQRRKKR